MSDSFGSKDDLKEESQATGDGDRAGAELPHETASRNTSGIMVIHNDADNQHINAIARDENRQQSTSRGGNNKTIVTAGTIASATSRSSPDKITAPQTACHKQAVTVTSSSSNIMDQLNRIANGVKSLPDLSDDDRHRQMSIIYSRRKRLKAKQQAAQLKVQVAALQQTNDELRSENASLETMFASVLQRIGLAVEQRQQQVQSQAAGLALAGAASLSYDSIIADTVPSYSGDPANDAAANASDFVDGYWLQRQQLLLRQRLALESSMQQQQQHRCHPSSMLSSLIGRSLLDDTSFNSAMAVAADDPSHISLAPSYSMPQQVPATAGGGRNNAEYGLIWQQIFQQQHFDRQLLLEQQQQCDYSTKLCPRGNSKYVDIQAMQTLQSSHLQQQQWQAPRQVEAQHGGLSQSLNDDAVCQVDAEALLIELRRKQQGSHGQDRSF